MPEEDFHLSDQARFQAHVGRPFKAGILVPTSGSRAASAALESHTLLGFAISSIAPRWGLGWVAETGLERPAYPQMPLRGNENIQTPDRGQSACRLRGAKQYRLA